MHRCRCHGGDALEDPFTGEQVAFEEACRIQEEREPGSMVPWPVFDNGWEPPTSDEGLVHVGVVERKPMEPMKGPGIFGLQVGLGEKLEPLKPLGSPLRGEPVHLTQDHVLDYFEGPILSLYRNTAGEPYLEMWADRDVGRERWLLFRVTEQKLVEYLQQGVPLRDLVLGAPDGYVFVKDCDSVGSWSWSLLPVAEIPDGLLPGEEYRFDLRIR